MSEIITFSITVFMGFFAIMNPISNLTVFMSLTEGADKETRARINIKAITTAAIVVIGFMLVGELIFNLFNITIPAFKITGGILVFIIGFDMVNSRKSTVQRLARVNINEDIAISPLAIPMIAGPGTIVTAMNFVSKASWQDEVLVIFIFLMVCFLNYLAFKLSDLIMKKLGHNVIAVIGKLMGLIIAIIGTGMIIEGLKLTFPVLN